MTRSHEHLKKSSTLSAGVVLVAALIGMFNYLGWKYYQRFDWTRTDLYTLSEKSESLMTTLDRKIEAIVFMGPDQPLFDSVVELLSRYEAASPDFSMRIVDPARNLVEAQSFVDRFELSQIDVVVLDSGDDRRIVEAADLAEYDYSGLQFGQGPEMKGFKGEQAFTGAILELIEETKPRILFTTGHGELRLDEFSGRGLSQVADLLRQDNFDIEEWQSLGKAAVPDDTALIAIAGPTTGFLEPELAALATYLDGGGRAIILLDPVVSDGAMVTTGLEELLEMYGVEVGDDIVVDPANPIPFYGPETIFVEAYGEHTTTRSLAEAAVPVIVPLARSVGSTGEDGDRGMVTELLLTSTDGWGETGLDALDRVERGADDVAGPVSIGVAVEAGGVPDGALGEEGDGRDPTAAARLIVIGDSDFATNGQLMNVGNTELTLNAFNWLVKREALVGIPPKLTEQVRLNLSGSQLRAISWLVFGILPGLSILAGSVVYVKRRR
jgi:ABC-type uncharacterized transport system involved in gliding motility auxiliary subunit